MPDTEIFLDRQPWPEALAALQKLKKVLEAERYAETDVLPMRGRFMHLPLDVANLAHFLVRQENQFHPSMIAPLLRALLALRMPRAVTLHRLLSENDTVARAEVEPILGTALVEGLLEIGAMRLVGESIQSQVQCAPSGGLLFLTDPLTYRERDDFVYLGRTSFVLPQLLPELGSLPPVPGSRLLDVGCGGGILGISLASRFEEVVGIDIVDRCLRYAELNAALNGVTNCRFHYSDVCAQVTGDFDLVVSNTPCGWVDPALNKQRIYAHGGEDFGSELPARILSEGAARLRPNGMMMVALSAPEFGRRKHIVSVLERALGGHKLQVTAHPVFTEYSFRRRRAFRQHGITTVTRYVILARPAAKYSCILLPPRGPRYRSYQSRAWINRQVARVTK